MMRNILLGATALVSSVMFLVPGAQAFDWNGGYIGGTLGVVKSTGSIDFYDFSGLSLGPDSIDFDGLGGIAGITWGYNFTLDNNMVVGVEADASVSNLTSSEFVDEIPDYTAEVEEALKSLLTLRGRIGFTSGETLFFATAGLAGGQTSSSALIYNGANEPIAATTSGFTVGVIGGVGVEHAIQPNLTVKGEILAYALGSLGGIGDTGKGAFSSTHNPSGVIFRTGINFHF